MQDRVPLYPGRVTLTPVSGQANTYDLTRADRPTQEGTPLNKASLLKDTTAALFGLGTDAVPDDALHLLSRFQSGLGNEYVWEKILFETHSEYNESNENLFVDFHDVPSAGVHQALRVTFIYGDTYSVNDDGSAITINQPNEITLYASNEDNSSVLNIMKGKWWSYKNYSYGNTAVYYLPESASIYRQGTSSSAKYFSNTPMIFRKNFRNVTTRTDAGYVNSPSPDAYPPAVSDGYTYNPLGQLGEKVRIATGSYTGTGTYGAGNPNSLTFAFEPVYILIFLVQNGIATYKTFFIKNAEKVYVSGVPVFYSIGTTTTWYCPSAGGQMNDAGETYVYFAIG